MDSPKKNEIYDAYYVLIEDGHDSTLWNSIYEGVRKEGQENCNAYGEYLGKNLTMIFLAIFPTEPSTLGFCLGFLTTVGMIVT